MKRHSADDSIKLEKAVESCGGLITIIRNAYRTYDKVKVNWAERTLRKRLWQINLMAQGLLKK